MATAKPGASHGHGLLGGLNRLEDYTIAAGHGGGSELHLVAQAAFLDGLPALASIGLPDDVVGHIGVIDRSVKLHGIAIVQIAAVLAHQTNDDVGGELRIIRVGDDTVSAPSRQPRQKPSARPE